MTVAVAFMVINIVLLHYSELIWCNLVSLSEGGIEKSIFLISIAVTLTVGQSMSPQSLATWA